MGARLGVVLVLGALLAISLVSISLAATVSLSTDEYLSATADSSADEGIYFIVVGQLAKPESHTEDNAIADADEKDRISRILISEMNFLKQRYGDC